MAVFEIVFELIPVAGEWFREQNSEAPNRRRRPRVAAQGEAILHWIGETGEFFQQTVEIRDTSEGGVGMVSPRGFAAGQTVWIEQHGELTKAIIRHSTELGINYLLGLRKVPVERRRQERQPVNEAGTLEWGRGRRSAVLVKNVSEDGIQLEVSDQIPKSLVVRLTFGSWLFLGLVCYCNRYAEKYLVGMQLVGKPDRTTDKENNHKLWMGGCDNTDSFHSSRILTVNDSLRPKQAAI